MSGPKHYNFPVRSREEARQILGQISGLQAGISVTVEDNELRFEVSESVWRSGVDDYTIYREIENARKELELRRIFEANLKKEQARIKNLIGKIDEEYNRAKTRLQNASKECDAILKKADKKFDSPFGTYSMPEQVKVVLDKKKEIDRELATLQTKKDNAIAVCKKAEQDIKVCSTAVELERIRDSVSFIGRFDDFVIGGVDELRKMVDEHSKRLEKFTLFLKNVHKTIQNTELAKYLESITEDVQKIDVFDNNAQAKIEELLSKFQELIEIQKEMERAKAQDAQISNEVNESIRVLNELRNELKPVFESIETERKLIADYSKQSGELIKSCEEVLRRIEAFENITSLDKKQVEYANKTIIFAKGMANTKMAVDSMRNLFVECDALHKKCERNDQIIRDFNQEYDKYEQLYCDLQVMLGMIESQDDLDKLGKFESPLSYVLTTENPQGYIDNLKTINGKLEDIVKQLKREARFGAIAKTVTGAPFKREIDEDGNEHMTYACSCSKGVLYDAVCTEDGGFDVLPRGVVLSNGKTTVTSEELEEIYKDCTWAADTSDAMKEMGLEDVFSYEELPDEIKQECLNEENFYVIDNDEDSVRFLHISGYTTQEIVECMEMEKEEIENIVEGVVQVVVSRTENEEQENQDDNSEEDDESTSGTSSMASSVGGSN